MGKKTKTYNFVTCKGVKPDHDLRKQQTSLKLKQRIRRKKPALRGSSIKVFVTGRNTGYCYIEGKKVDVIDIHGSTKAKNLKVSDSLESIRRMIFDIKNDGKNSLVFIHGKSRRGGWRGYLKRMSDCKHFKISYLLNKDGTKNRCVSLISF